MQFRKSYQEFSRLTEYMKNLALLTARLVLAYGFYGPSMMKWADMDAVGEWFAALGIPLPLLNAYLAGTVEITGVLLLGLGLFTRLISVPLMVVMVVAIITVHLPNGFSAGDNGFEIPLYYFLFLFIFLTHGPGKYSLDQLIYKKEA
jgi:putative oxidoreductase